MIFHDFEQGPIRPPDEADSLLIRTTRGCPWNRCAFCTLYKDMKFSVRTVDEIKQDIRAAQEFYQGVPVEKCFLQDGDSFVMKTPDLLEVLRALKLAFPSLKQISSYGRARTMVRKSLAEMKEIREAGLNLLYCGMETGSEAVLKLVRKAVDPGSILESARKALDAGMDFILFVILGLGGKELTKVHAEETADLVNAIDPTEVRFLTLAVKPGTELADMIQAKTFTMLTEEEMIREQRVILDRLNGIRSRYGNYHAVNLLLDLQGTLPEDKPQLLAVMDQFLNLDEEEKQNFILGRRLCLYARLKGFQQSPRYPLVQRELKKLKAYNPDEVEDFYHGQRMRLI